MRQLRQLFVVLFGTVTLAVNITSGHERLDQTVEKRLEAIEKRLDALESQLSHKSGDRPTPHQVMLKRELGTFAKKFHITLEYIAVETDTKALKVAITVQNIDNRTRYIWLPRTYRSSTTLIDAHEGHKYSIKAVSGISERKLAVRPMASKTAVFTFALPEDVRQARFASLLLTPHHVNLSIPFDIRP